MKLFLFGGAETDQGQAPILKQQINAIISELKPKQLLHIPYARTNVPSNEEYVWGDGWVKRDLNLNGIDLLDARSEDDIARANNPLVFINGGGNSMILIEKLLENKKLHDLVTRAEYIIGESAGSKVIAEFMPLNNDVKNAITKGLGILKNTIIEPHYSQLKRQNKLRDEMKENNIQYGVGIDSITAIIIDTDTYPKYETMGDGTVEFLDSNLLV